jgi:hypothetical protein
LLAGVSLDGVSIFLGHAAYASRSVITRRGRVLAKSRLKLISGLIGATIPWLERYMRGPQENASPELLCYHEEGLVGAVGIEPLYPARKVDASGGDIHPFKVTNKFLVNGEDKVIYKIIYSPVDEKPEVTCN